MDCGYEEDWHLAYKQSKEQRGIVMRPINVFGNLISVLCILCLLEVSVSLEVIESELSYGIISENEISVRESYLFKYDSNEEFTPFSLDNKDAKQLLTNTYVEKLNVNLEVKDYLYKDLTINSDENEFEYQLSFTIFGSFNDGTDDIILDGLLDELVLTNTTTLIISFPDKYHAEVIPFPDYYNATTLIWNRTLYFWAPKLVLVERSPDCHQQSSTNPLLEQLYLLQRIAYAEKNKTAIIILNNRINSLRQETCMNTTMISEINQTVISLEEDLRAGIVYCGNRICDENESPENCAEDCKTEKQAESAPLPAESERGIIDSLASQSDYDFFMNVVFLAAICFFIVNGAEYIRSLMASKKGNERDKLDSRTIDSKQRTDEEGSDVSGQRDKSDDDLMNSL